MPALSSGTSCHGAAGVVQTACLLHSFLLMSHPAESLCCCAADARWGKAAHLTFFFFCILTNILVTSMLLLGGAAVINALTGMNIYAVSASPPGLGCAFTPDCAGASHDAMLTFQSRRLVIRAVTNHAAVTIPWPGGHADPCGHHSVHSGGRPQGDITTHRIIFAVPCIALGLLLFPARAQKGAGF